MVMVVVVAEAGSDSCMWLKRCDRDAEIEADSRLIDGCKDIDVAHHCWRRQGI
jgi:hypothetical protein